MYVLQQTPDPKAILDNGEELKPLLTLKCEAGATAHIIEDDHCYVLCHDAGREDGRVAMVKWWFAEAFEAARSLPPLTPA